MARKRKGKGGRGKNELDSASSPPTPSEPESLVDLIRAGEKEETIRTQSESTAASDVTEGNEPDGESQEEAAESEEETEEPAETDWGKLEYRIFAALLIFRVATAIMLYTPDMDEVYNYWEPLHHIIHGYGFRTPEYSPDNRTGSYAYLYIHAVPLRFLSSIFHPTKMQQFQLLKILLAIVSVGCESYLYRCICKVFGKDIAVTYLLFSMGSWGTNIASVSFTSHSATMYLVILVCGALMTGNISLALIFLTISDILIPSIATAPIQGMIFFQFMYTKFESIGYSLFEETLQFVWNYWQDLITAYIIIGLPVAWIDSYYFGNSILSTLMDMFYRCFCSSGFGVSFMQIVKEKSFFRPTSFFLRSGVLNFNVLFLVSVLYLLVPEKMYLHNFEGSGRNKRISELHRCFVPLLVHLIVLSLQRSESASLMYPVYPLICLLTAIIVDGCIKQLSPIRGILFQAVVGGILVMFLALRAPVLWRMSDSVTKVYTSLSNRNLVTPDVEALDSVNVCVGKEWHRFPSHFFLPNNNWTLQFIQSDYSGHLPVKYPAGKHPTRALLDYNNSYVAIDDCHYLVDMDSGVETELEPRYSKSENWEKLFSMEVHNRSSSSFFLRSFYYPEQRCREHRVSGRRMSHYCHYDVFVYHVLRSRNLGK